MPSRNPSGSQPGAGTFSPAPAAAKKSGSGQLRLHNTAPDTIPLNNCLLWGITGVIGSKYVQESKVYSFFYMNQGCGSGSEFLILLTYISKFFNKNKIDVRKKKLNKKIRPDQGS